VTELSHALAALEADLERGRRALDRADADGRTAVVADDIRALLGALHRLVRRYHDIIGMDNNRRPRTTR
jgi:hypothetical protein